MISEKAFDVLRKTSLFAAFTEEQLEVVPKVALPRRFEPGDVIVAEGDNRARSLWLILEGKVEVRLAGKAILTLGPGSHFGEMALLTDEPRSADVVAVASTTALELSRRHLEGLITSDPQVAITMLGELARRLRSANQTIAEMIRSSPEAQSRAREMGFEPDQDELVTW